MNEGTIWTVLIVGNCASAIWVSLDIGKLNVELDKRVGWVMLCFIVWFIGLPIFLLKRREYKRLNFSNHMPQAGLSQGAIGKVLIIVAVLMLIYAANMDISVPVEPTGSRANLSRMSEKHDTFLNLGSALLIVGIILAVFGRRRNETDPGNLTPQVRNKCPACGCYMFAEDKFCGNCSQ